MNRRSAFAFFAATATLALACGETSDPQPDPTSNTSAGNGAGTSDTDASSQKTEACVTPVAGAACTVGVSSPCAQPDNACDAGYIWSCYPGTSTWYQEKIQCYTDATFKTTTKAACAANEVLYVDDIAGAPCILSSTDDAGAEQCPMDTYLASPRCCSGVTDARCVPAPSGCDATTCGCSNSVCSANCETAGNIQDGVSCVSAASSVIDCFCGKV